MYKEVINRSFNSVFERKNILMKALSIPLVLLIVLEQMSQLNLGNGLIVQGLLLISLLLININIAITTHRVLLDKGVPTWGLFSLGKREFKFILYTFLMARFSLVLPAIAIDEPTSLGEAWHYSKNYKLFTLVTVIIVPTIVAIVVTLVYSLVIGFLVGTVSESLNILYSVLNLFVTVFVISALSSTYKYIMDNKQEELIENIKEHKVTKEIRINEKDNFYRVFIPLCFDVSFDDIKYELYSQYNKLGFEDIAIDKENSWMLKKPENQDCYVCVSILEMDEELKVEVYNTIRPVLKVLEKQNDMDERL